MKPINLNMNKSKDKFSFSLEFLFKVSMTSGVGGHQLFSWLVKTVALGRAFATAA